MDFDTFDKHFCSKIDDLDGVCSLANALVYDHLVPIKMEDHSIYRMYHHGGAEWRFTLFGIVETTKNGSFVKSTGCTNVNRLPLLSSALIAFGSDQLLPITDQTIARDRLALAPPGPRMPRANTLFKNQLLRLVELVDRFEELYGATLHPNCIYPTVVSDDLPPGGLFCVDLPVKYAVPQPGEIISATSTRHLFHSIKEVPDYNPAELQMAEKKLCWQGLLTSDKTCIDPREIYEWLQPGAFVQMSCTFRVLINNGLIIPVLGADEIEIEMEYRALTGTPAEPRGFPSMCPAKGLVFDVLSNPFDVHAV
ncbi:hypothetical protein CCMSSC00406_0007094 [Pleurotus cornucopiae]|uniref:Uncharacterized protein n=1 Tax=Pleurotus cornucopiae TaxID=5321 RepID=A0ACB7J3V6_PLECO|nr:hypothetical protein CCMSSC00406_0007094 [Pleurotus cornucopiae]